MDYTNVSSEILDKLGFNIGKPETTTIENGRIRSLRHENVGEIRTITIMKRLKEDEKRMQYVANMVRHHMNPCNLFPEAKVKTTNRFFEMCICQRDLILLHFCNISGRKEISQAEINFWTDRLEKYEKK